MNGDETLEWDEFTGHIIELGMVRKDQTVTDAIKNYNLSELTDDKKHESSIEKVFSFDKIKSLLVMERDSLKYKVYDSVEGCFL